MNTEAITEAPSDSGRDRLGQFRPGNSFAFKPGESGSLRGRSDSLLDHLARLGREQIEGGKTRNAALAEGLWETALDSKSTRFKLQAMEMILDRIHGKPSQSVRLGVGNEQLSDDEIIAQVQASLTDRGMSTDETQRFLVALGVGDGIGSDTE